MKNGFSCTDMCKCIDCENDEQEYEHEIEYDEEQEEYVSED